MKIQWSWSLVLMSLLIQTGCGGNKEKLEKAQYLLARGGGENGVKAANILEPLLAKGSLSDRLMAHRLYGGAKINSAGLDGARFLSYLSHSSSNGNTVNLLKNIFGTVPVYSGETLLEDPTLVQIGEAADSYLAEGITAIAAFRGEAAYQAIETGDADYCKANRSLCRDKESVEVVLANLYFMRALNSAIRLSTLDGGFDQGDCETYFTDNETVIDNFSSSLVSSRESYALAGLDDDFYEGADGQTDAQNAKPNEFIDDMQAEIDPDKDGEIPGTANQKAIVICTYIDTQK